MGGLVQANGDLVRLAVADIYPGTLMALGMVSAIHHAKRTGKGQFFDVAMYDGILAMLQTNVAAYGFSREVPPEDGPRRPALMPFGLFPAKNGRVAIAAPQPFLAMSFMSRLLVRSMLWLSQTASWQSRSLSG